MNGVITVSCLGNFGRFGNMCFQWAVAKAYAESIGAELRTPNWPGRDLFEGANEKIMDGPAGAKFEGEIFDGSTNRDLYGYFQTAYHLNFLSRAKLKQWFKPKNPKNGHDLTIHIRHGDYEKAGCYGLIRPESYARAMRQKGYNFQNAVVYSDSRPVSSQYDDFLEIMASKVIFRANSTYSWWAAALSDAKVFSPIVEDRTGWLDVDFVEGNHPRLMYMFSDLHLKP